MEEFDFVSKDLLSKLLPFYVSCLLDVFFKYVLANLYLVLCICLLAIAVKKLSAQLIEEFIQWMKYRKGKGEALVYALQGFPNHWAAYCDEKSIQVPAPAPEPRRIFLPEINTRMGLRCALEKIENDFTTSMAKGVNLHGGFHMLKEFVSGLSTVDELSEASGDEGALSRLAHVKCVPCQFFKSDKGTGEPATKVQWSSTKKRSTNSSDLCIQFVPAL